MASKLDNITGIFKNVKSRTVFLGTIFLIILGLVIALGSLSHRSSEEGTVGDTRLTSAPGITGNPDVLGERDVSQQRARLTKVADDKAVWKAAATGGSALPTVKGEKTDTIARSYNERPLTEAEKQLEALVKGAGGQGQQGGGSGGGAGAGDSGAGGGAGASNRPLTDAERNRRILEASRRTAQSQEAAVDAQQARLKSQIYTESGGSGGSSGGGAQGSLSGAMASEVKQLLSSWAPTTQQYVFTGAGQATQRQGDADNQTSSGTATQPGGANTNTSTGDQTAQDTAPPLLKAGSIEFGILQTAVNTDEPGPIMATIETGQLRGAKLLGSIQKAGKYANGIALKFSTMTLPQYKSSLSINAFAIDPDTARTALASDTNHHYILRYGALFASSFLSGMGDAIGQSGQTTIIRTNGDEQQFFNELNTNEKLLYALGNVGNEMGDEVDQYFNRPTTIRIYSGTGIGILYMADVKRPGPDQLMR